MKENKSKKKNSFWKRFLFGTGILIFLGGPVNYGANAIYHNYIAMKYDNQAEKKYPLVRRGEFDLIRINNKTKQDLNDDPESFNDYITIKEKHLI